MSEIKRPLAMIVDDSPTQLKMMTVVLSRLGFQTETMTTARAFLGKIQTMSPDLCFIDLNIDSLGIGYTLVEQVRRSLGSRPVVMVASAVSEKNAIAHALEIGANDYLVKPFDLNVLAHKISQYIKTVEIEESLGNYSPVADRDSMASLFFDMKIQEVDEFGIKVLTRHLLSKGAFLKVGSPIIEEITGSSESIELTVSANWIEGMDESYGALLEFDATDDQLRAAVRRWLLSQQS